MWLKARDTLNRICDMAEEEGVVFTLENLNLLDHPGCPFGSTAAVLALVSSINRPQLRINLDLYHTQLGEGDIVRWCEKCLAFIGEVQVADNPGRCEPGTGEMNWPFIARALFDMGYRGPVGYGSLRERRSGSGARRFSAGFYDLSHGWQWSSSAQGNVVCVPRSRCVTTGFPGSVTLIGDEAGSPYERPPLSKNMQSQRKPIRSDEAFADAGIDYRHGVSATALDRAAKAVRLSDGTSVEYDKLLLATGAKARLFPGMKGCLTLRTHADALGIASLLTAGSRIGIIGGGFIGLELAAIARQAGADVDGDRSRAPSSRPRGSGSGRCRDTCAARSGRRRHPHGDRCCFLQRDDHCPR